MLSITLTKEYGTATKRGVLLKLAKIYDPLGLVSPTTLVGKLIYHDICDVQGWKMYRTTGPLVPENFWGCQKIFWQGGLPQFSRIIAVYVTNKGHINRYICNPIKLHAMTIYGFMFHAQMYCSLIFDRV